MLRGRSRSCRPSAGLCVGLQAVRSICLGLRSRSSQLARSGRRNVSWSQRPRQSSGLARLGGPACCGAFPRAGLLKAACACACGCAQAAW